MGRLAKEMILCKLLLFFLVLHCKAGVSGAGEYKGKGHGRGQQESLGRRRDTYVLSISLLRFLKNNFILTTDETSEVNLP